MSTTHQELLERAQSEIAASENTRIDLDRLSTLFETMADIMRDANFEPLPDFTSINESPSNP